MRVHRVFIEKLLEGENTLSSEESHHLARVLRVKVGQEIQAFDGQGYYANGTITTVHKNQVTANLQAKQSSSAEPTRKVTLAVGLPKGDAFETIIRMGTELGIVAFIPLLTEYGEVRSLKAHKLERYRRIALEATKQSGRCIIPHIHPMHTLEELILKTQKQYLKIVAHPYTTQRLNGLNITSDEHILCTTGPEGGISEKEITYMQENDFQTVAIHELILRAATAPIAISSHLLLS